MNVLLKYATSWHYGILPTISPRKKCPFEKEVTAKLNSLFRVFVYLHNYRNTKSTRNAGKTYNDVIVLYAVQLLEISGWKMLYLLLECHAVHQMHFIHRHKQSIHWSSSSFWSFYSFQLRWSLWTDETKFSSVPALSNCSFDDTKMRWDEMKKDIAKCFFSPSSALILLYRLVLYSVLFVHYTKKRIHHENEWHDKAAWLHQISHNVNSEYIVHLPISKISFWLFYSTWKS